MVTLGYMWITVGIVEVEDTPFGCLLMCIKYLKKQLEKNG
jgi:hypothetical protein